MFGNSRRGNHLGQRSCATAHTGRTYDRKRSDQKICPIPCEAGAVHIWLLHTLRAAAPKRSSWRTAEFTTLRLRLIKLAARVAEGVARIRVWLPTACPDAAIFRLLAGRFAAAGP
ncbi:MAG: transposase [Proteobacteria bacterium]|nr:transposase [Pseudomonadota bacterium]